MLVLVVLVWVGRNEGGAVVDACTRGGAGSPGGGPVSQSRGPREVGGYRGGLDVVVGKERTETFRSGIETTSTSRRVLENPTFYQYVFSLGGDDGDLSPPLPYRLAVFLFRFFGCCLARFSWLMS